MCCAFYRVEVCALTILRQGERLRAGGGEAVDDSEEDSDDDEDLEEDLGYLTPLDSVDPYVSFKQALTSTWFILWHDTDSHTLSLAFQMQNAAGYQAATTALDIDQQTLLMEVMRIAEQQSAPQV